jgi:hypothetical protein
VLGPFEVLKHALTLGSEAKPAAEPVAWWKLDEREGNTAADAAVNHLNGQIHGRALWAASRDKPDGALELDGTRTWVEGPDALEVASAGGLTASTWFKVRRFDVGQQSIMTKGDAWRIQRHGDTDQLEFATTGLSTTGASKGKSTTLTSKASVNDGQWHHVAATCDGKRLALHVDGIEQSSVTVSGKLAPNNVPVSLGENAVQRGRLFNGWLDDARVYGRALSAEEISALCKAGPH